MQDTRIELNSNPGLGYTIPPKGNLIKYIMVLCIRLNFMVFKYFDCDTFEIKYF